MSKNLLILLTGTLIVIIVGFSIYRSRKGTGAVPTTTETQTVSEDEESENKTQGMVIEIKNFKYLPDTLTVKAGEKVTVTNKDLAGHSVTSDEEGLFDSGVLGKDESGSIIAPDEPGSYPFHCTPHPSIKGTLVVE